MLKSGRPLQGETWHSKCLHCARLQLNTSTQYVYIHIIPTAYYDKLCMLTVLSVKYGYMPDLWMPCVVS